MPKSSIEYLFEALVAAALNQRMLLSTSRHRTLLIFLPKEVDCMGFVIRCPLDRNSREYPFYLLVVGLVFDTNLVDSP